MQKVTKLEIFIKRMTKIDVISRFINLTVNLQYEKHAGNLDFFENHGIIA